jgi:S-DNA-T family DNA segregation ATPase FtsK/SpoIIIE
MENTEPKKERKRKAPTEENAAPTAKKGAGNEVDTTEELKWWNDGRISKTIGLGLLIFAFIVLVAITSHIFSAAADQSEINNRAGAALMDNGAKVSNSMGRIGALLSYLLVERLFGFGAYLLAVLSFVFGFNLFFAKTSFRLLKWFVYGFVALVWVSALLAFINSLTVPDSVINWGGGFGNYLTGSEGILTGLLKPIGVAAILVAYSLLVLIWAFNYDFGKHITPTKKMEGDLGKGNGAPIVPAFVDEDENIFGKDKIKDAAPEPTFPEEEPAEMPEEEEEADLEMELINNAAPPISKKPTKNLDLELETEEDDALDLQVAEIKQEDKGETLGSIGTNYDPTLSLSNYVFPKLEYLDEHGNEKIKIDPEELERNKNQIVSTLNNYSIEISKIKATVGPTVTLYEIVPAAGVRISKIKNLEDDIALSLAALGIRIIAPIPGKGTIGIEVPNVNKEIVSMRSLLQSEKFQNTLQPIYRFVWVKRYPMKLL